MTGDCHVRILWEPGAETPRATRPSDIDGFAATGPPAVSDSP